MTKDSVILVIPVYNEEQCIEKVIVDWGSELTNRGIPFEILIINDGSTDQTAHILNRLANDHSTVSVIHQSNSGHGAAVKNGYIQASFSKHAYIFQTDSDDQFSPQDFIKLWEHRHESPAIFGHRIQRHDPFARKLISFCLRKTILDIFQVNIPDANIPYRLFKREYLKHCLSVLGPGLFAPNIFLSIISFVFLKDCPVIPVQHYARQSDTQKLVSWGLLKACFSSLWQLMSYAYQLPKKVEYLSSLEERGNITPIDQARQDLTVPDSFSHVA